MPEISIIVSTYNWPEALKLCLLSIRKQTVLPREVIIADDGSGSATKLIIEKIFPFPFCMYGMKISVSGKLSF
jgi:glycosyltransferase involved in cell wall biosynthesis